MVSMVTMVLLLSQPIVPNGKCGLLCHNDWENNGSKEEIYFLQITEFRTEKSIASIASDWIFFVSRKFVSNTV